MNWLAVVGSTQEVVTVLLAITVAVGWTMTWALAWEYRCNLRRAEADIDDLLAPKVRVQLRRIADDLDVDAWTPPLPVWFDEPVPALSPGMLALTQPWFEAPDPVTDRAPLVLPVAGWPAPPTIDQPAVAGIPTHEGPPDDEARVAMGEGPCPAGPKPADMWVGLAAQDLAG